MLNISNILIKTFFSNSSRCKGYRQPRVLSQRSARLNILRSTLFVNSALFYADISNVVHGTFKAFLIYGLQLLMLQLLMGLWPSRSTSSLVPFLTLLFF